MNTGFVRPAVATVLTVYGIETCEITSRTFNSHLVATVLTVYGIETYRRLIMLTKQFVATVLTVYGIETI